MEFIATSPRIGAWILSVLSIALLFTAWRLLVSLLLKPLRAKQFLEAQGLKGLPYRFFCGNVPEMIELTELARRLPMPKVTHDIAPRVIPFCYTWESKLGSPFFFWFGPQPRIFLPEPELAREILSNKFGQYRKPVLRPDISDLLGEGLAALEGDKWAQHRRIVGPAFFMEKLKAMTSAMAACTVSMLDGWAAEIEKENASSKEIDVYAEFPNLTADVIARTAFGTSYAEGKQVFQIQREKEMIFRKLFTRLYIPGSRFVPTRTNRYRWKLENQIQELLRQMINSRLEAVEQGQAKSYGDDLLGLMMAANRRELKGNKKNLSMGIGEMVDECKTFFLAGHESTYILLTWALLLLGTSTEWQERAREEVVRVCGNEVPTAESVTNLKTVSMVLYEALRLYPPVTTLTREVVQEVSLSKELALPKGSVVAIPIVALHHDSKYWGPDVHLFNPERFAEGIAKAGNNPLAFMPFGVGPRVCVGQNFALLEAKVVLTLILQRFAFHLSPAYTHAPHVNVTLQPQFGMQIVFEILPPKA